MNGLNERKNTMDKNKNTRILYQLFYLIVPVIIRRKYKGTQKQQF